MIGIIRKVKKIEKHLDYIFNNISDARIVLKKKDGTAYRGKTFYTGLIESDTKLVERLEKADIDFFDSRGYIIGTGMCTRERAILWYR